MLKFFPIFAIAALSIVTEAQAARPDTRKMTCAQARDFVVANGPVVMTYGYSDRAGSLYSTFSALPCRRGREESDVAAWVRTKDSASCYIGYVCN